MTDSHKPVFGLSSVVLALGTLGANISILSATKIDASRENGMYVIFVKMAGHFAGKTNTEGPIMFGICANLDAAELAAILGDDPQDSQKPTDTGRGSWYYPISLIGIDALEGDIMAKQGDTNVQAESAFESIRVKWAVPEGQNLSLFAHNFDTSALTTGMTARAIIQTYGAWLRD